MQPVDLCINNSILLFLRSAMGTLRLFVFCFSLASCMAEDRRFPPYFKFGAATSAYQIEGSWNVSDKSESIWDRYSHSVISKIKNNDNGDLACNSYQNFEEDIQMTVDLGLHFYRLSISWPRLLPTGFPNFISETGKKYYSDLIDGLLENGVEPFVTIYHWDLPQRLQDLGGWTNPMITDWFADYARVVFSLYADRVKSWVTINEPIIMCDATYNTGECAPGIKDTFASYICAKHVTVAHAKAWRIYDKDFKPKYKGRVGIANQLTWFDPDTPGDEYITELTRELYAGVYSHPIFSKQGGWPPVIEDIISKKSKQEGYPRSRLPAYTQEEIELVKGTYDFYAFNYYSGNIVREAKDGEKIGAWPLSGVPEFGAVTFNRPEWRPTSHEFMKVYPEGLRKQLVWLQENYGNIEYIITENGFHSSGQNLNDQDRIRYHEEHLEQHWGPNLEFYYMVTTSQTYTLQDQHLKIKRYGSGLREVHDLSCLILLAIKEDGINVTAYTVWSLMDNFEWIEGYSAKFGLYQVDFEDTSRIRTPRASARYYAAVIRSHSLDVNSIKNEDKYISDEL